LRSACITSSLTKYDHCLVKLPAEVIFSHPQLPHLARTGVADDIYELLEAKLTASFKKA
jgi:hypothetical protein